MSDVDLLREAADLMRRRAQAASRGPWSTGSDGLVWAPRIGDPVSGSTEIPDAEHIASWHPAVTLAVADWLESVTSRCDAYGITGSVDETYAVDVVRAYLGGVS